MNVKYHIILTGALLCVMLALFIPIPLTVIEIIMMVLFAYVFLFIIPVSFISQEPIRSIPSQIHILVIIQTFLLLISSKELITNHGAAGFFSTYISSRWFKNSYIEPIYLALLLLLVIIFIEKSFILRYSSIASRFILDTMPGIQMSIDSDISNGLISLETAKEKRKVLRENADCVAAVDGLGLIHYIMLIANGCVFVISTIFGFLKYHMINHDIIGLSRYIQHISMYLIVTVVIITFTIISSLWLVKIKIKQ